MSIPFLDLTAQYRRLKPELDAAIQRVLDRGQFILGPEGEHLERELAAYCGTRDAVAVASGTDALILALRACGIGAGDEVVTPCFSFFATAEAIVTVGATPRFVDIDPRTYAIDAGQVEATLTPRTKAVLPVHLFGHPCDMEPLQCLADRRGLALIEDCAQAIGARYQGKRVGSFGTAGCLSFYPTKNLGCYGDGGMVVTNDPALAERVRLLRTHGSRGGYHHTAIGTNSRLDELQAAILRVKLPHLDDWNQARRRHAETYRRLIEEVGLGRELGVPQELDGCEHVFHAYVIRSRQRDRLREILRQQHIAAQVYYPTTLLQQPALAFLPPRPGGCPAAAQAAAEVLALPMYPELTPPLIERVVEELAQTLVAK